MYSKGGVIFFMASNYIDKDREHQKRIIFIIGAITAVLVIVYICAKAAYVAESSQSENVTIDHILGALFIMTTEPFPISFNPAYFSKVFIPVMLIVAFAVFGVYDTQVRDKHKTAFSQYGTAKFMSTKMLAQFNREFNEPFGSTDSDAQSNIILTKNTRVSMNCKKLGNNNVLIIGSPGTGKSWAVVRPNLLQEFGSYVITDPSGELLATTGKFFEDRNYRLRVFNLVDMAHSNTYNPFRYIEKEEDVMTLINCLINCTSEGQKSSDPFWEKSETALLEAIIFYLIRYRPLEDQNFSMVSHMLATAKADKQGNSKLDQTFDAVRRIDPDDICVRQYDIFKQASDKTAQSILISAAVRLSAFNIDAVQNLTNYDQMDLTTIGDMPTVTFIIVPQGDNTYSFLVNMMYSQMFSTLYAHAAKSGDIALPYQVRFILDEFANIGVIPNFQQKLTTMRKYGLSCMIFIQAIGQIKNLYKDDWETIKGACSMILYLGGNETSTHEEIVKMAGKETMRVKDSSTSRNGKGSGSDSKSYKYAARDLLTIDEVRRLKNMHTLCFVSGQQPIYEMRYPTEKHPNAKYLGNLKTGENIYTFSYCNARAGNIKRLERNRKLYNNKLKEQQKSRNPEARPVTTPVPLDEKTMTAIVSDEEKKREVIKNIPMTGTSEGVMKQAGVIAGTIEKGNRKETSYVQPGEIDILRHLKSVSTSKTADKSVAARNEEAGSDALASLIDSLGDFGDNDN